MSAHVVSVSASSTHSFSKERLQRISLLQGLGVKGDAHCGETVKHRSRVAQDPTQPNLRQVHLVHSELFDELAARGFDVHAADIGENITTAGIDLLALPQGTLLRIGADAVVRITGLRNPCGQLDHFRDGLLSAVLERSKHEHKRKTSKKNNKNAGSEEHPTDTNHSELPPPPHLPLERV